jgi:metal-responsive CopG/Arc/MetJ family transcriptional regulator
MAQITATIPDEIVKKMDSSAIQKGISRSRWVAFAIIAYLDLDEKGSPPTEYRGMEGQPSMAQDEPGKVHESHVMDTEVYLERDHMKEEVQRLIHELEGKNQVIKLQTDEIAWLRGECAKLTDRMLIALPSPRQHWWEFWRQKS